MDNRERIRADKGWPAGEKVKENGAKTLNIRCRRKIARPLSACSGAM